MTAQDRIAPHRAQAPGGAPVEVAVIDSFEQFAAERRAWTDLLERDPESGLFMSWDWLAQPFLDNPGRWRVLVARRAGAGRAAVGYLPLKLRVHWSRSTQSCQTEIEAAGRLAGSEYTGFLCDPGMEDAVLAAFAGRLATMPWVRLSLRYEPTRRRAAIFGAAFPATGFAVSDRPYLINKGQTDNLLCPGVDLPDTYDRYLSERLGANTRQKIRRYSRQFLDTGALRFAVSDGTSLAQDLDALSRLWLDKWTAVHGAQGAGALIASYRRTLRNAHQLGALFMPVLYRGDRPLAVMGGIADTRLGRLHFIVSGRDTAEDNPAIGLLLHACAIRAAIARGMRLYDFCHGNEPYKYTFGATDRRTANLRVERTDLRGAVLDPLTYPLARDRAAQFRAEGRIAEAERILRHLPGPG